jgi:DNA-binding MarR family transcriptional regulator
MFRVRHQRCCAARLGERAEDPHDRRLSVIKLTAEGSEACAVASAALEEAFDGLHAAVAKSKLVPFHSVLRVIYDNATATLQENLGTEPK